MQIATDANLAVTLLVPVVGWNATSFPQLVTPASDERVKSGNPTLSWEELPRRIPGFSYHGVYAAVFRSDAPNYTWKRQWESEGLGWDDRSIVVGDQARGAGQQSLVPGRYIGWLSLHEVRKFGQIRVDRSSATKNSFFVD